MSDRETTKRRRPSLADVAEIAGVSISTVSKVANGSADVADHTRHRIEGILRERGYVVTRKRRGSLTPVSILARDMHSPFTLDVIRGAIVAAEPLGIDISVAVYPADAPDHAWIDELRAAGRRGVVAHTSVLDDQERARIAEHGLTLVVIDPLNTPDPSTYSVGATNWAGGLEATEHLLGLGHRRIVMLSGYEAAMASRARVSGYRAALNGWAGEHDGSRVIAGDFTYESGLDTGTRVLSGPNPPTAIFAASDFQALGVLEAARRRGLRVPEDLSVVGFDDLIMARMSAPPLTSVRQPRDQMGAAAIEALAALLGGSTTRPHHTELATQLVVRESTASPEQ